MSYPLTTSLIGSLKRKESSRLVVESNEMKRVRAHGVYGQTKIAQDWP
jgi:hypothetical protein